ncbi:MAG: rubrerythrin family protein [Candidatus Auribacterota bacterium]|nr:rubrerythrin family protein [Candidatus Auribacterota bacterium]
MNNDITSLIEESIKIELNVSKIYLLFHELFPDDDEFWWNLTLEEKNHAALIQSGKEHFEPLNKFPDGLLADSLRDLRDTNSNLHSIIRNFEKTPPSRKEAFNTALNIEYSAGELHFQTFMDKESDSTVDTIFQQLNKEDKEHALRIRAYMEEHDIPVI